MNSKKLRAKLEKRKAAIARELAALWALQEELENTLNALEEALQALSEI